MLIKSLNTWAYIDIYILSKNSIQILVVDIRGKDYLIIAKLIFS